MEKNFTKRVSTQFQPTYLPTHTTNENVRWREGDIVHVLCIIYVYLQLKYGGEVFFFPRVRNYNYNLLFRKHNALCRYSNNIIMHQITHRPHIFRRVCDARAHKIVNVLYNRRPNNDSMHVQCALCNWYVHRESERLRSRMRLL